MSETFPSRNVLPFQRPEAGTETRNRKLFETLVTALQQPVQDLCSQVFQSGDDALFDRSERAGSAEQQNVHFETMRRLRLSKVDLSARAFEFVQTELARLLGTRNERFGRSPAQMQAEALSLVDPDTIEAEIAAQASANRVRQKYAADFQALGKRLSTVQAPAVEGDTPLGLGPEVMCMGFLSALHHFECSLEARLVLMKLFERALLSDCEGLLMRAHAALNACQVATDVPYRAFQRPGSPTPTSAAPAPSASAHVGAAPAGGNYSVDQAILHSLRELINALGLRYAASHRTDTSANAPVASRQELAAAVQALTQQLDAPVREQRGDALSNAIAEALARQRNGDQVPIRPLDAGVIDLIGLMFDYTVSDRNIPADLQAILAHLQIPYLKLALADPQFLARKEHPARLLLNELAHASLGWTESGDRGLKALLEVMVQDLVSGKELTADHFTRLRKDLSEFCGRDAQRVQLAERKASQAADGRNRMDVARRDTEETLRSRLGQHEVPVVMAKLVEQYWQQYLILTHVRHGRDSREWLDAIRLIELLAAFPRADASPEQVAPWRRQFSDMETLLRSGLKQTGITEGDCDQVMAGLRELVHIERDIPVAATALAQARMQPRVRFDTVHHPDRPTAPQATEPTAVNVETQARLAESIDRARGLKSGQWFEMIKPDGKIEQVKLLWISGDHQHFMFVNGNGIKSAERKLPELAADLVSERFRLLDEQPLVERALAAAMQKVRGRRVV
ncbi:MAG: DUF1631 family protein [Ahniella sp.]|nr:DUF1631 family protein [Ahniella sp.]